MIQVRRKGMVVKLIYILVLFGVFGTCWGKEVIDSRVFQDWRVELLQDEWGDEKEVIIYGQGNVAISINSKYGFVRQNYRFEKLRDYWPYCEVASFAYRVDGGEPVRTGMGGHAASGGHCAWISMPGYMLEDMKRGGKLEVRAGYSNPSRKSISLDGFAAAWKYASSLCETAPEVNTWMRPQNR